MAMTSSSTHVVSTTRILLSAKYTATAMQRFTIHRTYGLQLVGIISIVVRTMVFTIYRAMLVSKWLPSYIC